MPYWTLIRSICSYIFLCCSRISCCWLTNICCCSASFCCKSTMICCWLFSISVNFSCPFARCSCSIRASSDGTSFSPEIQMINYCPSLLYYLFKSIPILANQWKVSLSSSHHCKVSFFTFFVAPSWNHKVFHFINILWNHCLPLLQGIN